MKGVGDKSLSLTIANGSDLSPTPFNLMVLLCDIFFIQKNIYR